MKFGVFLREHPKFYHNMAEAPYLYRWGMNAASTEFTQVIEGGQLEIFEL